MSADLKIYYDKDIDTDLIKESKVAIIGYGSQGHAHALNLAQSGVDVVVGLHAESKSREVAKSDGLTVTDVSEAVKGADWVMILTPDETQPKIFDEQILPFLKLGTTLSFGHGFNIHYKRIVPRDDLDVVMIAPKGPGHTVRSTYLAGGGVPALIAVAQDVSNNAEAKAASYAAAIGAGKTGVIVTDFRQETETDLFGEQAVLCGGISELILAGYETLTEAGYAPELAYFECLHETKLIVDLIYEGGIANMFYSVSNTAEYGGLTTGPKIIDDAVRERMKKVLQRVQDGSFAKEFVDDCEQGSPVLNSQREKLSQHSIEATGQKLRSMMQAVFGTKLVRKSG